MSYIPKMNRFRPRETATRLRGRPAAGPATSTPNSSRDAANLSVASTGLSVVEPPTNESVLILDDSTEEPQHFTARDKKRCSPKCPKRDSLNIFREPKRTKRASISFTGDERRKKDSQAVDVASDSSTEAAHGEHRCRYGCKAKKRPSAISDEDEKRESKCREGKAASEIRNVNHDGEQRRERSPHHPAVASEGPGTAGAGAKDQGGKPRGPPCHTADSLLVIKMAKLCLCNDAKDKNKDVGHTSVSINENANWKSEQRGSKRNAARESSATPAATSARAPGGSRPQCRGAHSLLVIEPAERCRCFQARAPQTKSKESLAVDGHGNREKTLQDDASKAGAADDNDTQVQRESLKVNAAELNKLKIATAVDKKNQSAALVGPNESTGACSDAGRAGGTAECLQSKLLATMTILENKEETIRVQAQSLAVAQQRIAALTERADLYRRQLCQLQSAPAQQADTAVNTDGHQDEVCQKNIVSSLQDNLSVIEELYRECFYETAKQDELIDLLRKSCSDVRVMDKHKTEQIGRLQNVVEGQKWSLEKCQDIATEVETLKMEISNFLNSSNQDSGMWEAQGVQGAQGEELAADLQHVAAQLQRLRDLLAQCECICGLKEENIKLSKRNEDLEAQDRELRRRVGELEAALQVQTREKLQREQRLDVKDQECRHMSQQVAVLERSCRDQAATCDSLTRQLQHCQTLLTAKSAEVEQLERQSEARERSASELREQLSEAQLAAEQESEVREEVRVLSRAVCAWRAQLAACQQRMRGLELELQQAREYCDHLAHHYREKERSALQLQSELEEAHSRGAQLCGDTRALVAGLRCLLRRHRDRIREQEDKIKEQGELIRTLQLSSPRAPEDPEDDPPCCSAYVPSEEPRREDEGSGRASEMANCTKCILLQQTSNDRGSEVHHYSKFCRAEEARGTERERTSGSEMTSRSSPPKPPRRLLRNKRPPSLPDCSWTRCEVAIQRPVRCDAATDGSSAQYGQQQLGQRAHEEYGQRAQQLPGSPCARSPSALCDCWSAPARNRRVSATEELLERVEGAQHALHAAHARWLSRTDTSARARPARRTRQAHSHKH